MELIPHGLSPRLFLAVFAVWLSSEIAPLPHPAPYPRKGPPEAVPQYVSESTSYHQVRLAFHSYPHLIRRLFTVHRFGPPVGLTPPSPWTWVAHLASGRSHRTLSPSSDSVSLRLRLPRLNLARYDHSQAHYSKGTRSLSLPLLVGIRFQVLFHSPPGVLFTFPSRYYALSVAKECLALEGGPPCFPQGFSCPVVLWIPAGWLCLSLTGLSPSAADLSRSFG